MRHVIMPNHAHFRVYIPPNTPRPLVLLGKFVSAFKNSTSMLLQYRGRPGPFTPLHRNPAETRREGWLDLNANLAEIADKAVYARIGVGGRLEW